MIYVILYSMLMPGTPAGQISGLWEDCFTDSIKAEREFKEKILSPTYFRKELWMKEPGGRRTMLKSESYHTANDIQEE